MGVAYIPKMIIVKIASLCPLYYSYCDM